LDPILALSAVELRDRLASGALKATGLARACLEQIAAREPEVQAWAWLESDYVMQQAEKLDAYRSTGQPIGPLHGLPVGLKDIIDTQKVPTENGNDLDRGRVPAADAVVVKKLKQAGAIIMGKTVTTELAFMAPSKTRNPHNIEHSPGGSSSGSAAAVAAGMVPLAVGTQTAGSTIRPAAFCGVAGFVPTFGAIPRTGILEQSPSLDSVGLFGKTAEDLALLGDALFGQDDGDPATSLAPPPRLLSTARSDPPVVPAIAFVRQPAWDEADEDTKAAFAELRDFLGDACTEVDLPEPFAEARAAHSRVQLAELSKSYFRYEERAAGSLSPETLKGIAGGRSIPARDYLGARDWPRILYPPLEQIFTRFDVILTPAAPGPAPGFGTTGSPAFNSLWTFCGMPQVTIPVLTAGNGLPMGAQLVGPRHADGRLLRAARWLARRLAEAKLGDNE
jgi:Asp-tRNA(Asn)/Glu-tRNA(Gln) amidotransferase A subunit family amidase